MTIGERIRAARKAKGWTQARLAAAVGISRPYLAQLETGFRDGSAQTIASIAAVLDMGCPFCGGEATPHPTAPQWAETWTAWR